MKKMNLLSKAEMRNVSGGLAAPCNNHLNGNDCSYEACIYGWNFDTHTPEQNQVKVDSCRMEVPTPTGPWV